MITVIREETLERRFDITKDEAREYLADLRGGDLDITEEQWANTSDQEIAGLILEAIESGKDGRLTARVRSRGTVEESGIWRVEYSD